MSAMKEPRGFAGLALTLAVVASAGVAAFAGPASSAEPVRVALGDTVSVETLCVVVALERAKARGVDYKLTSFAKEDLAIQAVINNQVDVGIATPFAVIQKTKAPLRGLFQVSRLIFFPVADKSYKTWKDLDGQPFAFHARGSGTEAIGNIIARREGISFGQRSYVAGSENRIVAMMNGQIKASIVDLANKNKLMEKAGDRFHVLPGVPEPASDEVLFAGMDWIAKNGERVDIIVEEFLRLWREMSKNPAVMDAERKRLGLLKELPKEALDGVTKFYVEGIKAGLFDAKGGGVEAAKSDLEFYTEAGQLTGPASVLKVEDFWNFGPLDKARKKLGG